MIEEIVKPEKVEKRKYFIRHESRVCVICGRTTNTRERVYDINKAGLIWMDTACSEHFI